jgi:hypothetical protein
MCQVLPRKAVTQVLGTMEVLLCGTSSTKLVQLVGQSTIAL